MGNCLEEALSSKPESWGWVTQVTMASDSSQGGMRTLSQATFWFLPPQANTLAQMRQGGSSIHPQAILKIIKVSHYKMQTSHLRQSVTGACGPILAGDFCSTRRGESGGTGGLGTWGSSHLPPTTQDGPVCGPVCAHMPAGHAYASQHV